MPQYFFHVSLELLLQPLTNPTLPRPQNPTRAAEALEPFLLNKRRKTSEYTYTNGHKSRHGPRAPTDDIEARQRLISSQFMPTSPDDGRCDNIYVEGTDMSSKHENHTTGMQEKDTQINKGIGSSTSGLQTRGHYVPIDHEPTNAGWGIVHLYRDLDETTSLYTHPPPELWNDGSAPHTNKHGSKPHPPPKDEDCMTLCILAVPSYLGPSDFLGWVGEKTRDDVSHFRMVRTGKQNRYMVLMKFRDGRKARAWQGEWNGKVFNSMEPETCHVVFLKSVEVIQNDGIESSVNGLTLDDGSTSAHPPTPTRTYPAIASDPFGSSQTTSSKPLPPPTPSLLELPTCPVCLERMDETTGLLTILCQHVFHCTCLQKWSGGGCPVCRYTFDDFSSAAVKSGKTKKKKVRSKYKSVNTLAGSDEYEPCDDDYDGLLECEDADCEVDAMGENALWQCLICGRVGCGRYEGKHAFKHFETSGHSFAMDLESKRVWDYKSDGYVHRILQDNGQAEKDSPARRIIGREDYQDYEDEKSEGREALGLEYTHLLTSQLESQRVYFEGVVERAVDKATLAARDAERALEASMQASGEIDHLRGEVKELRKRNEEYEKENSRLEKKARKFEDVARSVQRQVAEERETNKGLLERVTFLNTQIEGLMAEKTELEEMNHDLMMNFAAEEKVKELDAGYQERGLLEEGEIQEGSLTMEKGDKKETPAGTKRRKGKGKRKEGELVEPAQQPGG
jgi:BRCA1-associated protein